MNRRPNNRTVLVEFLLKFTSNNGRLDFYTVYARSKLIYVCVWTVVFSYKNDDTSASRRWCIQYL